ncbi:hypothetical protein R1flu_028066 [Riccia fluitans]|uniref:Uncharacterized protein n=1 Tax=Riccia fluitans TaxID=41844 RepID=A0ABD1XPM5_9MARC
MPSPPTQAHLAAIAVAAAGAATPAQQVLMDNINTVIKVWEKRDRVAKAALWDCCSKGIYSPKNVKLHTRSRKP